MNEEVILIDSDDQPIGTMAKLEAHILGRLHRAFSIFIFNSSGELLLQQRALHKYHSGGKWTNTCCSHPRYGEDNAAAADRRLNEEMGMNCKLEHVFSFTYKAEVEPGLIENEFDHVFFGSTDDLPVLNTDEVIAYKYMSMEQLETDLTLQPEQYTEWLKIVFKLVLAQYNKNFNNG
ncbi:isopentenyl-diphosphate Delta-isomerase [Pedobacter antarcticus]|uniref:Isopentenyl-diphosphate delta-isomerase n=2 Tax=Pedobacter antarcticus TaxID=34086 RepID=A0A081PCR4_9SPHI|nr:isopentenyl-diphosphate Delta-isomerase [Pedobacter antarcticus]KEQ28487.1 isopentenyl-diphosphate delta-isomerase [Pedobacter antarcticus 4BY]SDL82613.1 isopentenyl-diphosphate delta-isomerase [Pedobacter antarcticus]SFF02826.1 isopentenyl-diphosphate delta-isomerase [Pedobacter antarcticus]